MVGLVGLTINGAMTPKNVAIEDAELLERSAEIARSEGKTVDELATEAVKRDVARRWLERNKREAQVRRGNMTEEQVEAIVEKAVQETRAEQRARSRSGASGDSGFRRWQIS